MTAAQEAAIEARLRGAGKLLAQRDPAAWRALSADERTLLAARHAAADIKADADRKVRLAQLTVLAKAATESRLQDQMQRVNFTKAQAWADDIQQTSDRMTALTREYGAHMLDAFKAAESTEGAGAVRWLMMKALDAQNPLMTMDMAIEIHAKGKGGTGNRIAIAAAKAWIDGVSEPMRVRFNAAGGDVGKLQYGYMPTVWEPELVLKSGPDKFAEFIVSRLDRKRYINEDGSPMTDTQVVDFLREAGKTIQSDGANKAEPGKFKGAGARANSGSEHRQIHFKDGAAYVEAMREFGQGSMYDAMTGHLNMMARDIALVERYGPNPDAMHRQMRGQIVTEQPSGMPTLVAGADLNHHWRQIAGGAVAQWRWQPPLVGRGLEAVSGGRISGEFTGGGTARFMGHARNVETFSKLQGAVLSSITDVPMYMVAVHMNRLPWFDALANLPRAFAANTPLLNSVFGKNLVETMNTHGLMAETVIGRMNRFTGENAAGTWSGHVTSATMRITLMNWWTDSMRLAYNLTMQQAMARNVATEWGNLDAYARDAIFGRHGLTEQHWDVLRQAQQVQTDWGPMITPEAIYATGHPQAAETANAYLAFLTNRNESAILNPDVAARAFWRRSSESGTVGGEAARAMAQFQMFPTSMFTRFYRDVLQTPRGLEGAPAGFGDMPFNRLAFIGSTVAALTFFGAMSLQSKQIKDGKDPLDMTTAKFWFRALSQGGGFSYFSGLLLEDSSDSRSIADPLFRLQGPLAGSVAELLELTKGNIDESMAGKDAHIGAEAIRFARGHAPLLNTWYLKTAIDMAGLHALQEAASPGYLSRMKQRARRDWDQDYFAPPGGSFEDMRAPDLSAAFGN